MACLERSSAYPPVLKALSAPLILEQQRRGTTPRARRRNAGDETASTPGTLIRKAAKSGRLASFLLSLSLSPRVAFADPLAFAARTVLESRPEKGNPQHEQRPRDRRVLHDSCLPLLFPSSLSLSLLMPSPRVR